LQEAHQAFKEALKNKTNWTNIDVFSRFVLETLCESPSTGLKASRKVLSKLTRVKELLVDNGLIKNIVAQGAFSLKYRIESSNNPCVTKLYGCFAWKKEQTPELSEVSSVSNSILSESKENKDEIQPTAPRAGDDKNEVKSSATRTGEIPTLDDLKLRIIEGYSNTDTLRHRIKLFSTNAERRYAADLKDNFEDDIRCYKAGLPLNLPLLPADFHSASDSEFQTKCKKNKELVKMLAEGCVEGKPPKVYHKEYQQMKYEMYIESLENLDTMKLKV
jgi:hypothetical protein